MPISEQDIQNLLEGHFPNILLLLLLLLSLLLFTAIEFSHSGSSPYTSN